MVKTLVLSTLMSRTAALFAWALVIASLLVVAAESAASSSESAVRIIRSSADWRQLIATTAVSADSSGVSGRLVVFTASSANLCPDCGHAEHLARRFVNAPGAAAFSPHQTVFVVCDEVAPGAVPCADVPSLPHIAGYTFVPKSDDAAHGEDDAEGEGRSSSPSATTAAALSPSLTLDLTAAASVDQSRIAEWLLSLPQRSSSGNQQVGEDEEEGGGSPFAEHLGEVIAKEHTARAIAAMADDDSKDSTHDGAAAKKQPTEWVSSTAVSLHTFAPRVRPLVAKAMEAELSAHSGASLVLLTSAGCEKCAAPLLSLERLGKALAASGDLLADTKKKPASSAGGKEEVMLRRVTIDANIRADFGLSDSADVPILLAYHKHRLCGGGVDDTSEPLTSTGRWARCAPIVYTGGMGAVDLLAFVQRELGAARDTVVEDYAAISAAATTSSPLSSQLASFKKTSVAAGKGSKGSEKKKKALTHGISFVFDATSTSKDATDFLSQRCGLNAKGRATKSGCYVQLLSTWYTPLFPLLQQQINVFVGASIMASAAAADNDNGNDKDKSENSFVFAVVDVAAVPSDVLAVFADAFGDKTADANRSVSSFCPNALCSFAVSGGAASRLPQLLTASDFGSAFSLSDVPANSHARLLARGSRFYRASAGAVTTVEASAKYPNTKNNKVTVPYASAATDSFVRAAEEGGCHVLSFTIPRYSSFPSISGQQLTLRALVAFEGLCQSLNATNDDGSGAEGLIRCVVADANRNADSAAALPHHSNNNHAPAIVFSHSGGKQTSSGYVYDDEGRRYLAATAAGVIVGGKKDATAHEAVLSLLRDSLLFERQLCRRAAIVCRPQRFARPIRAGAFEAFVNDPEHAKFVLFGGGPSCPHTPLLAATLERVAAVHSRDRHEVTIAIVENAAAELSPALRALYGVGAAVPQMRFYPRGRRSGSAGVSVGERYAGTTNAEAIFEFIHTEMGYGFFDYDYQQQRSVRAVTARDFAAQFDPEVSSEANTTHSVLLLYDTVVADRLALDAVFRLDRRYFNFDPSKAADEGQQNNRNVPDDGEGNDDDYEDDDGDESSSSSKGVAKESKEEEVLQPASPFAGTVHFFKMDARQFAKIASRHHLSSVLGANFDADSTKGGSKQLLPQLLFLPKGPSKLRTFVKYTAESNTNKRLGVVSAASFVVECLSQFEPSAVAFEGLSETPEAAASRLFNFTDDEKREHETAKAEAAYAKAAADAISDEEPAAAGAGIADPLRPRASKEAAKKKPSKSAASLPEKLSIDTFKEFVAGRGDRIVLFYTTSCPHCAAYRGYFDAAAAHYSGDDGIAFGSINLERDGEVGHMQGIQTIPSVKVYFEGSVDKATEFRGEDFVGSKKTAEALIEYVQSIRGSAKVAELDQLRALRDAAIPTLANTSLLDTLTNYATNEAESGGSGGDTVLTVTKDFMPTTDAFSTPDVAVSIYDDRTFRPPLLLEVAMAYCGHCYHLSGVLISLDSYFRQHHPLPRPVGVSEADAHLQFAKIDGNAHATVAARFGVTEFPTLILFFTEALADGTMRHKSVKYSGFRNNKAIGEFIVKHLGDSVHPSVAAPIAAAPTTDGDDTADVDTDDEAATSPPAGAPTGNPFEDEAAHQQRMAEEEEETAVFNESIAVFNPRLVRTALLRTSAVLVMTYSLPRDQPFVLVMNELHKVLSKMPVVAKGMLSTAIFPEHQLNDEIEALTGWSRTARKPFISLFRGMVSPQIVTFNKTSMRGIGETPPRDAEDMHYDQPTPAMLLQFLDAYAKDVFVLPRSLNETTFEANMKRLTARRSSSSSSSSSDSHLTRWAVLFTHYECALCHKMLQSTSYSAQAQMALRDRTSEVTVLDVSRARRIYKQWGSPTLPALVVFERPPAADEEVEGAGPITIESARLLRIQPYAEGEEDLAIPKRRQVHEFIFGLGDHPQDVIRPALSARVNGKQLIAKATKAFAAIAKTAGGSAAGVAAVRASSALEGAVATVGSASDLEHALRNAKSAAIGRPTLVLIRGDICHSCGRIEAALLTTLLASRSPSAGPLSAGGTGGLPLVEVQLPQRSRTMERELVTMGFAQLSSPSVYLVYVHPRTGQRTMVKFGGRKEDSVALLDFVLENAPRG